MKSNLLLVAAVALVCSCTSNLPAEKLSFSLEENSFCFPAWKGEKVNARGEVASTVDLSGASLTISDLKSGSNVIPSSEVYLSFIGDVMGDVLDTARYNQCGARPVGMYDSLLVADILYPAENTEIKADKPQPVWVSVKVPAETAAGEYEGKITLKASYDGGKCSRTLPVKITVADKTLPAPHDWKFHLDLWQNPYSVARYYGVEPWSQEHFDKMRPIMQILADAGQKVVTTTIMEKPWNGQTEDPFDAMVTKTKAADGTWTYDYTAFDKWVEFMFGIGIDQQISCYTLIPWHLTYDYINAETGETEYITCAPGTPEYKAYWGPFVADFAQHLRDKGWFDKTMIAMDERPLDAMLAALDVIRSIVPDFKVTLAGSYHDELAEALEDYTIGFRADWPQEALAARKAKGWSTLMYTCCAEGHPNTFSASDPSEATWLGWNVLSRNLDGYLRWAYNSWTKDPFKDSRFRTWAAGDCYIVYPDGISSVRMEKLIEGIQDYEKAHILMDEWASQEGGAEKIEAFKKALEDFNFDTLMKEGAAPAIARARAILAED